MTRRCVTPLGNDAIIGGAVPGMRMSAHRLGRPGRHRRWHRRPFRAGASLVGARRARPAHGAVGGFVVEAPAGKVYFAGDTGFHDGANYRAIGEKHGGFRLAILPIGAYEPRWFMEAQHQNPEEAVRGMLLCDAAYARRLPLGHVPAHQRADRRAGRETRRGAGCPELPRDRFRALRPGEVWDVPAVRLASGHAGQRNPRHCRQVCRRFRNCRLFQSAGCVVFS